MWCTSRASPLSTISPTRVRLRSLTRCWCTAPTSSSDGIGAFSASTPRLDSTISRAPSSIAAETSSAISPSRQSRPAPPPDAGKTPRTVCEAKPGCSPSSLMWMIFASSSLLSTGNGRITLRQLAGPGASRFCSEPSWQSSEVTSSSRIASNGGFVTWANSWVK